MIGQVQITAIVGSLRESSFNMQLAIEAGKLVAGQADFNILDYRDVPFMNQDIEFPAPEPVRMVRELIKSSDGLWFFTPEYNHFFPGVLKNLLDWLSRPISASEPQVLEGKMAAISGIGAGMAGTGIAQDHLVTLLSFLNLRIMNKPRLTIPNALKLLDSDGNLDFSASLPYLEKQASSFLDFIQSNN